MGRSIPEWERELWSYLSSGDGMHCPLVGDCEVKQEGYWCAGDNIEYVKSLLGAQTFKFSDYDFLRPERMCRILQLVEILAQECFKKVGIQSLPVPAELIHQVDSKHKVEVRKVPLVTYHAGVWRLKDSWVIHLNENDTPAIQRFTLFHEAFHILAHRKATPVFKKRGMVRGSFNELLADCFATCVLMPKEWVQEKWAEVHDLNKMAQIFDVPRSVACISLRKQGLI